MQVLYDNRYINIYECKTFFSRLKGFMFTKKINHALLFNNCNSIHTFFMKTNIDVIMCDKDNNVLYYYNNFGKRKIIWPKRNVYRVIELPVNYFNVKVGHKITIQK